MAVSAVILTISVIKFLHGVGGYTPIFLCILGVSGGALCVLDPDGMIRMAETPRKAVFLVRKVVLTFFYSLISMCVCGLVLNNIHDFRDFLIIFGVWGSFGIIMGLFDYFIHAKDDCN